MLPGPELGGENLYVDDEAVAAYDQLTGTPLRPTEAEWHKAATSADRNDPVLAVLLLQHRAERNNLHRSRDPSALVDVQRSSFFARRDERLSTRKRSDWSTSNVEVTLFALVSVLSLTRNLETLHLDAHGSIAELGRALSSAAMSPRRGIDLSSFTFRLQTLNVFSADGLDGFLVSHPEIVRLVVNARGDRAVEETFLTPSILPNLQTLETSWPGGLVYTMRGRPVRRLTTTIRQIEVIAQLAEAMESSSVGLEELQVVLEVGDSLKTFLEHLVGVQVDAKASPENSAAMSCLPPIGLHYSRMPRPPRLPQECGAGSTLTYLSISLQAFQNQGISPSLISQWHAGSRGRPVDLSGPSALQSEIISIITAPGNFPYLSTLRWSGALVPHMVANPLTWALAANNRVGDAGGHCGDKGWELARKC